MTHIAEWDFSNRHCQIDHPGVQDGKHAFGTTLPTRKSGIGDWPKAI
jgi:hypothetical protein